MWKKEREIVPTVTLTAPPLATGQSTHSCATVDSSSCIENTHKHTHSDTIGSHPVAGRGMLYSHIWPQHTCHNRAQLSSASPFTLYVTSLSTHKHTHLQSTRLHIYEKTDIFSYNRTQLAPSLFKLVA